MTFRWLVRLAAWLDSRFPPKVTVTDELYNALTDRVHRQDKMAASLHNRLEDALGRLLALESSKPSDATNDRIEALESKLADLAKALAHPKQTDSEVMRAAFLRGEFPRTASRTELEAQK